MRARFGEYEEGVLIMRPPQAWWDTTSKPKVTVLTVDSANRDGSLLEIVQLLNDLDLVIHKATISSDGCWLLDVFHIVDHLGRKVVDERILQYINAVLRKDQQVITSMGDLRTSMGRPMRRMNELGRLQAIELMGIDHPGLLSECAGILSHQDYVVVAAGLWTHAGRVASVIYVKDEEEYAAKRCSARERQEREEKVLSAFKDILQGEQGKEDTKTKPMASFTTGLIQPERHLHRLLFADRDYDDSSVLQLPMDETKIPSIGVRNCPDTNYSVIYIRSADRPKLLFDALCTLTDMKYNVYHATIDTADGIAEQEYYVKDMDNCLLTTDAERIKVTKCLLAAIERRTSEGVCLVLKEQDSLGLLAKVTTALHAHDLTVTQADIDTLDGRADNVFYVMASDGTMPSMELILTMQRKIGSSLQIRLPPKPAPPPRPFIVERTAAIFKSLHQFLQVYGLVKT